MRESRIGRDMSGVVSGVALSVRYVAGKTCRAFQEDVQNGCLTRISLDEEPGEECVRKRDTKDRATTCDVDGHDGAESLPLHHSA